MCYLQGYVEADYPDLCAVLGYPTVFCEWKVQGYDLYGEEIEIVISGEFENQKQWKVICELNCGLEIIQNKVTNYQKKVLKKS